MTSIRIALMACAVPLAIASCHGSYRDTATTTAARHLFCESASLRVHEVRSWAFHAVGCGREGWFRCHERRGKVCCRPTASEEEARATFSPHPYGGHFTSDDQVCD